MTDAVKSISQGYCLIHTSIFKVYSVYETYILSRLFKTQKNGVYLFGISFFLLEILAILYYANWESDGVCN